jgi:cysteine desulfurase/selenocysteine lyase
MNKHFPDFDFLNLESFHACETFDVEAIRNDFPILHQQIYGKPFVYFDNAATTQKPLPVIDITTKLQTTANSNIHRGVHFLSEKLTSAYEKSRKIVQNFVNAKHLHEIIFTSGATESINLVAFSFGEKFIKENDEIIVSEMEHHSNIVPWQMMCERKGAKIKVFRFDDNGELHPDELKSLITEKTKLIAVTHVSNALGTINPIKEIIEIAHSNGVPVLIDGAQAIQHLKIDVQQLDCDFYAFSGHKMYGPNGIGILYGKEKWLQQIPPYKGGGDMIDKVTFEKTTYNESPLKFEAGTPNYPGAIGLAKAIQYINRIGLDKITAHEHELMIYATEKLLQIEELKIYGTAKEKTGVISFLINGIHPYDAGMIIDKIGVALRTGTQCTQPIMDHFEIHGTVRASFGLYNTKQEVDVLFKALLQVKQMFG